MRLIFSIVLFFIVTTNLYAQKANSDEQLKAIDSITFNMKVDKGLITTYQNKKNELYFEIDKGGIKSIEQCKFYGDIDDIL